MSKYLNDRKFRIQIYNFELTRYSGDKNVTDPSVEEAGNILRWIAPEKLTDSQYTTQGEIFSFGMLIWELILKKFHLKVGK
jgi:hypothetical protein